MIAGQNSSDVSSSTHLVTQLFDTQPDSVVWFIPVFKDGEGSELIDLEVGYCNTAAALTLKSTRQRVTGSRLRSSALMDEVSRNNIWEQCVKVWNTGEHFEFAYYSPGLDKHFNVQRSKVENGILSITRDQTQLMRTREEKDAQARLLTQLIQSAPYGIALYESIRSNDGKIKDFRLRICNEKSAEITAFSIEELYKYTVKELMVVRGHSNYFDMCVNVVETGRAVYNEYFANPRGSWISFTVSKFEDGYLVHYSDITRTKSLEKQALQQADMLQGILDSSLTGLFALEAMYGYSGKVIDFKFTMFNKACEKLMGIKNEDKSKSYLSLYPTAKINGMFDIYTGVLESGKPVKTEFHYKGEGFNGLYLISVSKMGDHGIVQSFTELEKKG